MEVEISASPHHVWNVMADVERWSEWTPSIKSIQILGSTGSKLNSGVEARVRQPHLPATIWRVTQFKPDSGFVWEAKSVGAFTRAEHWIYSKGQSHCTVLLSIEIRGMLEPLLRPWLKKMVSQNVAMEAAGLKRRSEEQAQKAA